MKIFLKLKHWQLFLVWILSQFLFIATLHTDFWLITFEFYAFTAVGWIYSIGKVTSKLNSDNKSKNYKEELLMILYLISGIPFAWTFRDFF
ncbi:hypothetical protein ACE1ET_05655 [Saccharicrinis sp. FJH62]|uniref:hypothetical protein n=1 Tax=Saccharicrinis sp. FJH62 TaxID=3344657 RepID=UPI0035D50924